MDGKTPYYKENTGFMAPARGEGTAHKRGSPTTGEQRAMGATRKGKTQTAGTKHTKQKEHGSQFEW